MFATPTVVGGLLYVGSCSGNLYAFDRLSGEVRWSYDTARDGQAGSFHGDPLVAGDLILVGTDAPEIGHLYAFELETGKVRWKTRYGRGVPTDILPHGSDALAMTLEGELLCLDAASGERRWSVPPAPPSPEAPERRLKHTLLVRGDHVFSTTNDLALQAVDARTGEVLWKTELGARANTGLANIGDDLYLGTLDERFLHIDARSGSVLASYTPGGVPFGTPVVADGSLLLLVAPTWLVRLSSSLLPEWIAATGAEPSSFRPLVGGGQVRVGDEAGRLYSFNLADGALTRTDVFEGVLRGLGSQGGILYLGTLKGRVYAFRP